MGSPNTASKRWVYRQYDHEVGVRTAVRPGDDAAVLAVREAGVGLAVSSGAAPNWTAAAPEAGARAVALENATNLAAKGALPLAAVDCLNGGNPEKPAVFGGFAAVVDGLAAMCRDLGVPVVGGNVSLYNDSETGPVPPTPTLMMVGTADGYDAPPMRLQGGGDLLLVGEPAGRLGGSEYLARFGGADRFPDLPAEPRTVVEALAEVAGLESTHAVHDVSHGGLAVALAEMIHAEAGASVALGGQGASPAERLFSEAPGRVVVETNDPGAVRAAVGGVLPVAAIGEATGSGELDVEVGGERLVYGADEISELRSVIERELD